MAANPLRWTERLQLSWDVVSINEYFNEAKNVFQKNSMTSPMIIPVTLGTD